MTDNNSKSFVLLSDDTTTLDSISDEEELFQETIDELRDSSILNMFLDIKDYCRLNSSYLFDKINISILTDYIDFIDEQL